MTLLKGVVSSLTLNKMLLPYSQPQLLHFSITSEENINVRIACNGALSQTYTSNRRRRPNEIEIDMARFPIYYSHHDLRHLHLFLMHTRRNHHHRHDHDNDYQGEDELKGSAENNNNNNKKDTHTSK